MTGSDQQASRSLTPLEPPAIQIDAAAVSQEYERRRPVLVSLVEEVRHCLRTALEHQDIRYHEITGRVKTLESFLDKVKRKQTADPFGDITDLAGARVICLFLSQLDDADKAIQSTFKVLETDYKIKDSPEGQFGYFSNHYIVAIPDAFVGPRYDGIRHLRCEIQVRTIAMDAWANVSHNLSYKQPTDVPSDLRRDFYALSGLFYVADTHFEMFYRAAHTRREELATEVQRDATSLDRQELNVDTLATLLAEVFPDRAESERALSGLLRGLQAAGYRTVGEVRLDIEKGRQRMEEYDARHPPRYARLFAALSALMHAGTRGKMVQTEFLKEL